MATRDNTKQNESQIRALIEGWAKAIRGKDLTGAVGCYAADVLVFDLAPPLQHAGREGIKKGLQEWFPTWQGPIGLELRDLRVTAGDDVAYCTALQRMTGTKVDGEKAGLWYRATVCLRKIDGTWCIVHEHSSTPFYMDGSYKAAVDLQP